MKKKKKRIKVRKEIERRRRNCSSLQPDANVYWHNLWWDQLETVISGQECKNSGKWSWHERLTMNVEAVGIFWVIRMQVPVKKQPSSPLLGHTSFFCVTFTSPSRPFFLLFLLQTASSNAFRFYLLPHCTSSPSTSSSCCYISQYKARGNENERFVCR